MKIHHKIHEIQNILVQEVHNNVRYFIKITWNNHMGSMHVLTKKSMLHEKVLELSENYTKYYGKEYKVKQIIVMNKKNKNLHIKTNIT
jgi:hypothetical protein